MSDGGVRKGECEQGGLDRGGKRGGGTQSGKGYMFLWSNSHNAVALAMLNS